MLESGQGHSFGLLWMADSWPLRNECPVEVRIDQARLDLVPSPGLALACFYSCRVASIVLVALMASNFNADLHRRSQCFPLIVSTVAIPSPNRTTFMIFSCTG